MSCSCVGGVPTHLGAVRTPLNHVSPGGDPQPHPGIEASPFVRTEIRESWGEWSLPQAALPAPP